MRRVVTFIVLILVVALFNSCDTTGSAAWGKVYVKNSSGRDVSNIEIGPITINSLNAGEDSSDYFYSSYSAVTISVPGFTPPSGMSGKINLRTGSLYTLSIYKTSGGDYLFNMQGIIFDDSGTIEAMW